MKNVDLIFFDFDGVIAESFDVKTNGFRRLFEDRTEFVDEIVAYHCRNGGVSRYVKIRHIYKEILREPLSEELYEDLCRKYSQLVFEEVIKSPFVCGAVEFLEKYYKNVPFYIISGTPEEEMRRIVKDKKLEKFFLGVYGSPTSKGDRVKEILDKNDFDKNKIYFIGDALSDYEAAVQNDIRFILRVIESEQHLFEQCDIDIKVKDFIECEKYFLGI